LMDAREYNEARITFEMLLRVNHDWPGVDKMLVLAHAHGRRGAGRVELVPGIAFGDEARALATYQGFWNRGDKAQVLGFGSSSGPLLVMMPWGKKVNAQAEHFESGSEENMIKGEGDAKSLQQRVKEAEEEVNYDSSDHYHVLRSSHDSSDDELKRAYKHLSKKLHPDRKGGDVAAFQRVASANTVLSDPIARRAYDEGEGVNRHPDHDMPTLFEEVVRRYYPERYGWQAFGDPHEEKRRVMGQRKDREIRMRREEEEREQLRQRQESERAAEGAPGQDRDEL